MPEEAMPVTVTPVESEKPALGLEVSWDGGQYVQVIAHRGVVTCGVVDMTVMEKFGAAFALTRGTPEKPLRTVSDLLNARILEVTSAAAALGVEKGMSGKEALAKLSM
jgi:uncharacterized protein YunC (DUF1805 family)